MTTKSETEGTLLHAKHALQPNSLGYCGPDENGVILEHVHESSVSGRLTSMLTRFEAAYPFVRMIASSTGRSPFDREVTEAYWIGNSLLDLVQPSDFYRFAREALSPSRKAGRKDDVHGQETRHLFKELGPMARPHHTFYVLGLYSRSDPNPGSESKLLGLMDSCRISWGRVVEVKKASLVVERPALSTDFLGRLSLTPPRKEEVRYDPQVPSFSNVAHGDWVSIHWNFASERLASYQLRNLKKHTMVDIQATNRLARSSPGPK